jgi:N-acetylglucosamine-6-phosphate deacetylase
LKAILNGKILTENSVQNEKVLIFNNKILEIVDKDKFYKEDYLKKYEKIEIIDAKGNYISPGFIDIHIHGSGGCDAMDGTIESIKTISETICQNGVTSFLPTTMTMGKEDIYKALDCIRVAKTEIFKGAKVLGAHMEGPFINEKYKGAQSATFISIPEYSFIHDYLDVIKIITLAPETDSNFEFIKKVRNNTDIILSIGHSNASYEEAVAAIDAGISHATHTFNAMTPLNHRNPGVVGAIFNTPISCELIADNIHVHPGAINTLLKVKEKKDVVLITDCMRAGSLSPGHYDLGGQEVVVDDNSARLINGTLAGSILKLNIALKNIYENTDLSLNEVINLVSINAAKVIKIDSTKGSIEENKDADLLILDSNFNILTTFVEGQIVFINKDGVLDESNNC